MTYLSMQLRYVAIYVTGVLNVWSYFKSRNDNFTFDCISHWKLMNITGGLESLFDWATNSEILHHRTIIRNMYKLHLTLNISQQLYDFEDTARVES